MLFVFETITYFRYQIQIKVKPPVTIRWVLTRSTGRLFALLCLSKFLQRLYQILLNITIKIPASFIKLQSLVNDLCMQASACNLNQEKKHYEDINYSPQNNNFLILFVT